MPKHSFNIKNTLFLISHYLRVTHHQGYSIYLGESGPCLVSIESLSSVSTSPSTKHTDLQIVNRKQTQHFSSHFIGQVSRTGRLHLKGNSEERFCLRPIKSKAGNTWFMVLIILMENNHHASARQAALWM